MIHIYKYGGEWKTSDGKEYSIKAIDRSVLQDHLSNGWKETLAEVKKPRAKKATKDDNKG
jgi:hypothetical protein